MADTAHIATLLPTQNRVVAVDTNTTFLAHYDLNEHDVLCNVKAIGSATSLNVNGTSYVDCGDWNVFNSFPNGLTIEGWGMQTASSTADGWMMDKDVTGYRIWGQGVHRFMVRTPSASSWITVDSPDALALNTWYHVAGVVDNINLTASIYVNGVLKKTVTLTSALAFGNDNTPGLSLKIGSHSNGGIKWPGQAMNIKVWNRPLSASEIVASMNNQAVNESSLVGFWKLNDGQGVIAKDYSPFHNDGVITGTYSWSNGNSVFTLRPKEGYFGGSAMAVEEATTNLYSSNQATGGDTTNNTTGWAANWGTTISRTTDYTYNGAGSIKAVTQGANADEGASAQISGTAASTTYTFSGWIMTTDSGVSVCSQLTQTNVGGIAYGPSVTLLPNQWTYFTLTATTPSTFNGQLQGKITTASAKACTLYNDQFQIEQKGYATSFVNGTRTAGYLAYPVSVFNKDEFTVSAWVNLNTIGSVQYLVSANNGNPSRFDMSLNSGTPRIEYYDGTTTYGVTGSSAVTARAWNHVVYRYSRSAGMMAIFLNGVKTESAVTVPAVGTLTNLFIGTDYNGISNVLNGLIDELRFDNIARTDAEITAWYYSASPFWPRGTYRKPY